VIAALRGAHRLTLLGLFVVLIILVFGIFIAFQRGGNDFSVFYGSWYLVSHGRGPHINFETPDRYLYAPGLAWLLSPLGLLPKQLVFSLWCLAKALALYVVGKNLVRLSKLPESLSIGIAAGAIIMAARPLLIDFQYGQVNTFILAVCIWTLGRRWDGTSTLSGHFGRWFLLAIAAVAKVFATPLLLIPFFVKKDVPQKQIQYERLAVVLGLFVVLLLPIVSEGLKGNLQMLIHWKNALFDRGMPIESHNQSISAFLARFFTGQPVHIIALGPGSTKLFDLPLISSNLLKYISALWTAVSSVLLLVLILRGPKTSVLRWVALVVGLLVVPSHLVWKPYFIFIIPLAFVALSDWYRVRSRFRIVMFVLAFVAMNLNTFSFFPSLIAAKIESASVMMFAHLAILCSVLLTLKKEKNVF